MTRVALVLTVCLALVVPAAARADEFTEHLTNAATHVQVDELEQALADYKAAYALRQQPNLLLAMARVERRLGHAREAAELYRRWLATGDEADPAARAEAEEAIGALLRLPDLRPPAAPSGPSMTVLQPVRYVMRPQMGLVTGGAVLFSTAYLAASLSGGAFAMIGRGSCYDSCSSGDLSVAGGLLFIPLVGPIAAGIAYREPYWALPWALVDAPAQIAGFAMMIAGLKHKRPVPFFDKVQFVPSASAAGGGLMVTGRF